MLPVKVPVTMRALMQRINRKLKKEEVILKTLRTQRYEPDLGRYYAVNMQTNLITAQHVDPEQWGRELGVLRRWEVLKEEA